MDMITGLLKIKCKGTNFTPDKYPERSQNKKRKDKNF